MQVRPGDDPAQPSRPDTTPVSGQIGRLKEGHPAAPSRIGSEPLASAQERTVRLSSGAIWRVRSSFMIESLSARKSLSSRHRNLPS